MRYYILFFIFLFPSFLPAQDHNSERIMDRIYKSKGLKKALKDTVNTKAVFVRSYSDPVFPNADILKLKNVEAIALRGEYKKSVSGDTLLVPTIRVDTALLKQLPGLKYLAFESFDFSRFPEEICYLKKLKGLTLAACKIKNLPPAIAKLSELTFIECRLNELEGLPEELSLMRKLEVLDLCNNKFTRIPIQIIKLPALRIVNFANTEMSKFSAASPKMPFNFYVNKIEYLIEYQTVKIILQSPQLEKFSANISKCLDETPFLELLSSDGIFNKVIFSRNGCD